MHALLLRSQRPGEALEIARRALVHADNAGRHDVQHWSAAGFGFIANYLGHPQEAIDVLEQVLVHQAGNGTRHLFALSQLAEAYGAAGDRENVQRSLRLLENAREKVATGDEFGNHRIDDQKAHSSTALLRSGQLRDSIRYAEDVFGLGPHPWHVMRASVNIAIASGSAGRLGCGRN